MGGEGSGRFRRSGARPTVDQVPRLDVRPWARQGLLVDGQWFAAPMLGRGAGYPLTIQVEGDAVRILRQFDTPSDRAPVGFRVQLDRTYPPFGGSRWWFLCPQSDCNRRVALIHAAGREFVCRRCLGLVYESQRENRRWRALRMAQKIRVRLGGSANALTPLPQKPRGMHTRTYVRLLTEASAAEQAFWLGVDSRRPYLQSVYEP